MVELESIFRHKSPNGEKLISNGFAYSKRGYSKTFAVLCGQFHVRVRVSKKENVDFRVYEAESCLLYTSSRFWLYSAVFPMAEMERFELSRRFPDLLP